MKAGTIFDHPTKDGGCESFDILGSNELREVCGDNKVIYKKVDTRLPRIMEAVRNNTESYGEEQDAILEELISKILEE